MKLLQSLSLCAAFAAWSISCIPKPSQDSEILDMPKKNPQAKDKSSWVAYLYTGKLPQLKRTGQNKIHINISTKGLTTRVTGFLSEKVSSLPAHVKKTGTVDAAGHEEVVIVYPVAIGKQLSCWVTRDISNYQHKDCTALYRDKIVAYPFNPNGMQSGDEAWGGFPFLQYSSRAHAFHGPISDTDFQKQKYWRLKRGPVSLGCSRMQGEHVVELSHLIGVPMRKPVKSYKENPITITGLDINVTEDYDRMPAKWSNAELRGKYVDVNYPASPSESDKNKPDRVPDPVLASRKFPTKTYVFPTWDAKTLPNQVCEHQYALQKQTGVWKTLYEKWLDVIEVCPPT